MENLLSQMKEAVNNKTAKVLTLEAAKLLKGKKIRTIYFGYRGQDGVDEFIVGDIKSAWDLAALEVDPKNFPQGNRQLYWASYMGESAINSNKNKLILLDSNGVDHFIYCHKESGNFTEETFTCSDQDRAVFYVLIEETHLVITDYSENNGEAFIVTKEKFINKFPSHLYTMNQGRDRRRGSDGSRFP